MGGKRGAQTASRGTRTASEATPTEQGEQATICEALVASWHAWLEEPTLADAILDRLVHGAHRIILKGESLRGK